MEIQNVGHPAPSPDPNDRRAVEVLLRGRYHDQRYGPARPVGACPTDRADRPMKLTSDRPLSDPDKAARKLVEVGMKAKASK
jgi:hypothetical protein